MKYLQQSSLGMMAAVLLILQFSASAQFVNDLKNSNIFKTDRSSRIVGGSDVPANAYPWFARAVLSPGGSGPDWFGCGGSLISSDYVLTAAHCITSDFEKEGGYQIGSLCWPYRKGDNCGQDVEHIEVDAITIHPQYNSHRLENDLALVKLKRSSRIKPVNIDNGVLSPNYIQNKDDLWAIGLGLTNLNGGNSIPDHLQHVKVKYVTNDSCINDFSYLPRDITHSMMCALDSASDSCHGDSGGPLYDLVNNTLVGVTSWGRGCANADFPGVYARVAHSFDWIRENVCPDRTKSTMPSWCPIQSSPTTSPTLIPTPVSPPSNTYDCVDSQLSFKVRGKGPKDCTWVAEDSSTRCAMWKVETHCPKTCNMCELKCEDSRRKIFIKRNKTRGCYWVRARNRESRCERNGMRSTCRKSCGYC